jgi:predicted O-methyltransferase YrrM
MNKGFFRITHFIVHFLTSIRNHMGFGVQSPFAFSLLNDVIREKLPYYSFQLLNDVRKVLAKDKTILLCNEQGAKRPARKVKTVASVLRSSVKSQRQQEMLFRLVQFRKPEKLLEIGTSLGLTTAYLALGSNSKVVTIEGCKACAARANELHQSIQLATIKVVEGDFDNVLPAVLDEMQQVDFVFIDGNHRGEALLRYFEKCLMHTTPGAIIVVDATFPITRMCVATTKRRGSVGVNAGFLAPCARALAF